MNLNVGVSIDTRSLERGNIFVAIVGDQHDGHDYVQEAKNRGASLAIVQRQLDVDIPQMVVDDTTKALGEIAREWRQQFSIPVIGITGSNGKTTVRNMVAAILKAAVGEDAVLVSEKNYNNHWGLPLTLCQLRAHHRYAVVEMGMNHAGEIAYLVDIAKPDIAVITLAAEVHLEGLGSLENIAKAKGEILGGLSPEGVAVLNAEDRFFDYWKSLLHGQRVISFDLSLVGEREVSLPGRHNGMNAAAAIAAVSGLNPPPSEAVIIQGLQNVKPQSGRLCFKTSRHGALIIDDTYNCSMASLNAAIAVLNTQEGKRIAVLGDMSELGEKAESIHREVAAVVKADVFVAVGAMMKHAYDAYQGEKYYYPSKEEALPLVRSLDRSGNVLLFKGSRRMQMEKMLGIDFF